MAYTSHDNPTYLYRVGVVIGCLDSAFFAEVLAMEWALEEFYKFFVGKRRVENQQVVDM